ncbi:MAG: DUF3048 domain-containing protein [Oscillospiraceae bacterium]
MKRLVALLLCSVIALSLFSSCKKEEPEPVVTEPIPVAPEPEPEPEPIKLNYNYLNGLYDLPDDRVGMRPIAVSVNNNYASWPQYGISKADILFEIETEGGITRLMAIFSDVSDAGYIGSVRSLRHQFLEGVYQWNPIITHIGTSDFCNERLYMYGVNTLDGYYTEDFLYVDRERMKTYASEHCKFTNSELIPKGIKTLDLNPKLEKDMAPAFNFNVDENTPVMPGTGSAGSFTFEFSGEYDGDFRYNAVDRKYCKWQDGEKQIDAGNGNTQLSFDNVFVLFAYIGGIANSELVDVDYEDGGEGYYFSQGRYEHLTWEKPDWNGDFSFKKDDGSDLIVNTGTTYVSVIRDYFDDTLEIKEQ